MTTARAKITTPPETKPADPETKPAVDETPGPETETPAPAAEAVDTAPPEAEAPVTPLPPPPPPEPAEQAASVSFPAYVYDRTGALVPNPALYLPDPVAIDRLNGALSAAQGEFPTVPKNKTAKVKIRQEKGGGEYSYKYADLADVLKACLPALSRHGLCLRQPIKRIGGAMFLVTELHHASGQYCTDDGIPLHSNLPPQEFGSEVTYARRYGACTMIGVAPDEDEDGKLADTAVKEQRQLAQAQERNRRAEGTDTTKPATAKATPKKDEPADPNVITDAQVKQWNKARKASGYTVEEALEYVNKALGFPLNKLPVKLWDAAWAWANTPKPAAANPTDDGKPLDQQPADTDPTKISHGQKTAFWDTARKHGKTDGEMAAYLKTLGIENSADMPLSVYTAALEWATRPIHSQKMSPAEQQAREGFGILGLNFTEQSSLIDSSAGDWEKVLRLVQGEIDRREAEVDDSAEDTPA